jgi:hypothetical protein
MINRAHIKPRANNIPSMKTLDVLLPSKVGPKSLLFPNASRVVATISRYITRTRDTIMVRENQK